MITLPEFPNRVFKNWDEAHAALKEHEKRLIGLKCSQIYKSIDKLQGFSITPFLDKSLVSAKSHVPTWMKEGNVYPVINTTLYRDSHKDVHFNELWKRSIKNNVGKLYYVEGHELMTKSIIAWPEDVKAFTAMVPWSFLGKSYEGETQALIYEIPDAAIKHEGARDVIDNKRDMQNSVRMQYVKMSLALNSDSSEWKENKELYDSRIDLVANKDVIEAEDNYFWAVDEAKIFKEGSMVIAGSNDVTPIIYEDPAKSTSSDTDPPEGTQLSDAQKAENAFYNNLI